MSKSAKAWKPATTVITGALLLLSLMLATACKNKSGNSADSKSSVQIARNKAGDFGLNKGGTLSATYASNSHKDFQWTGNGTWVVKPTFNDMAMLDCSAGIFYLGCQQYYYSRGYPNLYASHIFDKDGKLVHQFQNEYLDQMAGDVGIVYRSIPNPVNANHNAEAFLFSFATLQTVKAIGKNAVFIKNGKYIQANGDVWQEKVLGGTKTHTQKRFYDRAGNLIFEAANVTQVGDNKEYGDWVTVTVNYGAAQWLNLANGKTYPWKYGENYPPEETDESQTLKTIVDTVPMPQLQKLDKLTSADMTDVKVCGFYGKVKTVKIKGKSEEEFFNFDPKGKIIYDDSDVKFSNVMHFQLRRDDRTTSGANNRKDVGEWATIEFKFDLYGRLVSSDQTSGDDKESHTYTHNGANMFPSSEESYTMTQDGDWGESIKYKYQAFDKYGNWTKRTAIITTEGWSEENGKVSKHKKTETKTQTAEYTYYDGAVAVFVH